jgi:hypothetical protein
MFPKLLVFASFEAFTAVLFQVEVFWVVTPCNVAVGCRRFRGICYLQISVFILLVKKFLVFKELENS